MRSLYKKNYRIHNKSKKFHFKLLKLQILCLTNIKFKILREILIIERIVQAKANQTLTFLIDISHKRYLWLIINKRVLRLYKFLNKTKYNRLSKYKKEIVLVNFRIKIELLCSKL